MRQELGAKEVVGLPTIKEAPSLEPQIRVSMMLADAAQVADGKLSVLGGGWSQTGPAPTPFAIAMDVKVPWRMANAKHQFRLELVDSSGRTVSLPAPDGEEQLIVLERDLEVGRSSGDSAGVGARRAAGDRVPDRPAAGARDALRVASDGGRGG